jgi:uncharacterized protein involved in exopolysaccharide biosynthesis
VLIAARNQAATELNVARKDYNDKSLKYTEQHPDVRAAAARVAAAEGQYKAAEEAIAQAQAAAAPPRAPAPMSTEDPYEDPKPKPAGGALASSSAEEDKPRPPKPKDESSGTQLVNLETEWSRINRAVNSARAHQADLEGKLFKAEIVASSEAGGYGAQLLILDPAFKPGAPTGMPKKTMLAIGFVASFLVGLVISAAWGLFLDDRLFHSSEVDGLVEGVPLLGVVPKTKREPKKRRWVRG